jgi:hypothetical protein
MIEQLTHPKASNWVDRGEPPEPELRRVLTHYLGPDARLTAEQLDAHVRAIRGMVEADASEVQLAGYLGEVEREAAVPDEWQRRRRGAAIALWHMAKCAEIRERARRLMQFGI